MDIGADLHDNMINFHGIVRGAKRGQVMIGRPLPLILEDAFFKDSYVLELNNQLYTFRYNLRRINRDIENFNRAYGVLADAIMLGQVEPEHIALQLNGLLSENDKLRKGFKDLLDESVQLLGYVRARMEKDKTWLMRRRGKIIQAGVKPVPDEEVKKQVEKHLKDIVDNQ
jgi:hypothetical protein